MFPRNGYYCFIYFTYIVLGVGCFPLNNEFKPTISSATPEPLTIEDIFYFASSSNYMQECISVYPNKISDQASYKGIFPGISSEQDVENSLGVPVSKNNAFIQSWEYKGDPVVVFEDEQVESIWVYKDTNIILPLRQFVSNYGCPDLIIAYDTNQHPVSEYAMSSLIYLTLGLEINFYTFPVKLEQKPDFVIFLQQESMMEYLIRMRDTLEMPNKAKPVTWDEVITE